MKLIIFPLLLLVSLNVVAGGLPQGCPQALDLKFGYMSISRAMTNAGGGARDSKSEHFCWVSKATISGQMKAESHGDHSDITSEYEYRINGGELHASARLYGALTHAKLGAAGGSTLLWVSWRDQVTFHSNQIPVATRDMIFDPDPLKVQLNASRSSFVIHGKLLQYPPANCSGASSKFRYLTGIVALLRDIMGEGVAYGSAPDEPYQGPETFLLRMDRCGVGEGGARETAIAQNGIPMALQVTAQITLLGKLDHSGGEPEAHLKVDFPSLRLCFVRPSDPSDVTMTSASGADYWCP